jgi:hypothetical protein
VTAGDQRRAGPDALRVLAHGVKLYSVHPWKDLVEDCYRLGRVVTGDGARSFLFERDASGHFRFSQTLYEHDQTGLTQRFDQSRRRRVVCVRE